MIIAEGPTDTSIEPQEIYNLYLSHQESLNSCISVRGHYTVVVKCQATLGFHLRSATSFLRDLDRGITFKRLYLLSFKGEKYIHKGLGPILATKLRDQ